MKDKKDEVKKDDVVVEEEGKKVDQFGPFLIGSIALLVVVLFSYFILPRLIGGILSTILFIIVFLILIFLILWFYWAPNSVIGLFIPEGYCTIITRGQEEGQFVKAMMKYKGYTIDDDHNIIKMYDGETEEDYIGFWDRSHFGMNFYFWPFDKVYTYNFEWKQFTHDEKVVKRKGHLYHVLLKPYIYYIDIKNAEDKNKVPQDMGIVAEMKVINPYKAIFRIQNWYRAVSNLIIGDLRDFIRSKSYEELINPPVGSGSLNEMIWDQRIKIGLAEEIKEKYGVEIIKLTVVEIEPSDEEYSRATLRKIIAEKNQEAIKVEAASEAIKRSTETMGLVTAMFLNRTKMTEEHLATLISEDPEGFEKKYGKIFAECLDLVQREMALAKGRFIDIRTDAAGIKGGDSLLALIAANSMLNNQSGSAGVKAAPEKKENTTKHKPF